LLAQRCAASATDHACWSAAIEAQLRQAFALEGPWVVGFCWPYQAEFDARPFAAWLHARGVRTALPLVVAKGQPLEFRAWWPGVAMQAGVYGIPVPLNTPLLLPDVLLVPPVGLDAQGYRLGYGGGYFDRTLAALARKPLCIATAFEVSRIETIGPQAHDVRMDYVLTESTLQYWDGQALQACNAATLRTHIRVSAAARGLPQPQPAHP
jgi:5-formyltetrahydrofolate cyclo-ligase